MPLCPSCGHVEPTTVDKAVQTSEHWAVTTWDRVLEARSVPIPSVSPPTLNTNQEPWDRERAARQAHPRPPTTPLSRPLTFTGRSPHITDEPICLQPPPEERICTITEIRWGNSVEDHLAPPLPVPSSTAPVTAAVPPVAPLVQAPRRASPRRSDPPKPRGHPLPLAGPSRRPLRYVYDVPPPGMPVPFGLPPGRRLQDVPADLRPLFELYQPLPYPRQAPTTPTTSSGPGK